MCEYVSYVSMSHCVSCVVQRSVSDGMLSSHPRSCQKASKVKESTSRERRQVNEIKGIVFKHLVGKNSCIQFITNEQVKLISFI